MSNPAGGSSHEDAEITFGVGRESADGRNQHNCASGTYRNFWGGTMSRPQLWEWIKRNDPALYAYANRDEHTDEERQAFLMGMAVGRIDASHELLDFHTDGIIDTASAVDMYLYVQQGMTRQRDSARLLRALARERAVNVETRPRPDITTLLVEIDQSLDFVRDFVDEMRVKHLSGEGLTNADCDGLLGVAAALGTTHDEEENDGQA